MSILGRLAIIIVAATVVAGCLSDKSKPDPSIPPAETASSTATMTTAPGGNLTRGDNPEVPSHEMLLTNCQTARPFLNYPAGLAPGERPDGWGPDPIDKETAAAVSIHAYKCERIAIADYERGPIHLLMDHHGNAAIPPDCSADTNGITNFRILRHLFIDDPEIGAYIEFTYGIPVLVADFAVLDRDAGAGTFHDWTWSLDDGAPSAVTVLEPAVIDPYPTLRDRFFWQIGNGLGAFQIEAEGDGPNGELPANGTIQPPVLLASDTAGHFVGQGIWLENVSAQGVFTRYSDLECKEPLT